jgi:hypothetical protein
MQGERVKRLDEAQVSGFGFAPDVTLAMQANLAVMQTLQEEITACELEEQHVAPWRAVLEFPSPGSHLAKAPWGCV